MTGPEEQNRIFWNDRFSGESYFYGQQPNAWLAARKRYFRPGQRVLVPADGEGRNSVWCAQQGLVVDAFDFSSVALEKAKVLAKARGVAVNYTQSTLDDREWAEEAYDAVVLVFMNFATPNMRKRLFENSLKTLKAGGLLFVLGYDIRQLQFGTGGPDRPEQLYTIAMLLEAFSGMEILELEDFDENISEGKGHNGPSALIGMVARKRPKTRLSTGR